MPDANSHNKAERQSGSPRLIAPLISPTMAVPAEKKALVNVVTFEGDDIEVDRGTIEIPRATLEVIRREGTISVDWADDCLTINLGLYHESLSIHVCPKDE